MRNPALLIITTLSLALTFGCLEEEEEVPPTGIEVSPPEVLDYGTIYECTEHYGDITIINHGPDTENVDVDVDTLIPKGFVVNAFMANLTLAPGDEHGMAVGVAPGAGGAGEREGSVFINTSERAIVIKVKVNVIEGDECD